MLDSDLRNKLYSIDLTDIKEVQIRTIGLLDVFGKMIIDVSYNNGAENSIEIISPVPVDIVKDWLNKNNLLDKTVLYKF